MPCLRGQTKTCAGMTIATFERIERGSANAWPRAIATDQSQVRNPGQLSDFTQMRRPRVHGKFLYIGRDHFWIRGVTYGTFRPDPTGLQFPTKDLVKRDFRAIAEAGLNSIRVYTTPPRWLLDEAARC